MGSMSEGEPNIARLQREGFAIKTPLPAEYEEVLNSLTYEEVAVLVDVKRRLEDAERLTKPEVGPYREYFHPF